MKKSLISEATGSGGSGKFKVPIVLVPQKWTDNQLSPFTDSLYDYTTTEALLFDQSLPRDENGLDVGSKSNADYQTLYNTFINNEQAYKNKIVLDDSIRCIERAR